jgi:hypothetical protein
MPSSAAITSYLQVVSLAGFVLAGLRLCASGLASKYRIFLAYLVFSVVHSAVLMNLPVRSAGYMKAFVLTEPLLWLFYILVVLELYRLVLEQYPGLLTLGRWALYGSIAVSVLLSALALLPGLAASAAQKSRVLSWYFVIERGVVCSLLLFLFLILLLLRGYPVRLSRNVVVHCFVYSVFFFSSTAVLLLRGVFDLKVSATVNLIITGITSICALLWAILLSRKGEARLVSLAGFTAEQEESIRTKLETLNTTVLRVSRN